MDPPWRDDVPEIDLKHGAGRLGMTRGEQEALDALAGLGRDVVAGGMADRSPTDLMRLAYAKARKAIEEDVQRRRGGRSGGRLY